MRYSLFAPPLFAILTGCGGTPPIIPDMKPTLTMSCSSECSVEYRDPRDKPTLPTNGYDVANNLIGTLGNVAISAAPWAAVGLIATKGITNAGDRSVTTETADSTHTPTVVTAPEPVVVEQPQPLIYSPSTGDTP